MLSISILFLLYGLWKSDVKVCNVASLLIFGGAVIAYAAFLTGEGAEEFIEHRAGVSEQLIENHEEAAESAIWLVIGTGIIALITLLLQWRRKTVHKLFLWITLVSTLLATTALARLGYLGGQINHPELSNSTTDRSSISVPESSQRSQHDEDHDD